MKILRWTILIFVLSVCWRLWINFSQELIPGTNGGYYPLQVRSLLHSGNLAFSDMPFLFYINAFIIKIITLFGVPVSECLILIVVKIIDSFAFPFMLFPLHGLLKKSKPSQLLVIGILIFSMFSFSPLILISDLQKNALAIVFTLNSIAYYYAYQYNGKGIYILGAIIFFMLTGFTHFGTFVFLLFWFTALLLHVYKRKAFIPVLFVLTISLSLVFVFDTTRFYRLITLWNVLFERPAILNGMLMPPDLFNILFSLVLAFYGLSTLLTKEQHFTNMHKSILFASLISLIVCSFPLLDVEYFKRLSLFLFITQILLMLQISRILTYKKQQRLGLILIVLSFFSTLAMLGHPKEAVVSDLAYQELKSMDQVLENKNKSIIVARHGLEWWIAWALNTKVAQDKALDSMVNLKYEYIIFLKQLKMNSLEKDISPFHEPKIPQNANIIFSSQHFEAYQYKSD